VSEADCGVVTGCVRDRLRQLGESSPGKLILADSRERIGLFRQVWLKPNRTECLRAVGAGKADQVPTENLEACVRQLASWSVRPVFCTCSDHGIVVADPRLGTKQVERVPAFAVQGPVDTVGAGDSTSAGIACAVAAGADCKTAAAFGNLVASITIQQIGTTGTASPEQVRQRWREVRGE
jgi:sugar/nucleoside kinase (ribokinase family)